jgi:hypothetical protein
MFSKSKGLASCPLSDSFATAAATAPKVVAATDATTTP